MQVVPQPTAFLFPGGHEPGPRILQVEGEVHRIERHRRVPGQVVEHGSVGGGQLPAGGDVDDQIAEMLSLVDQRGAHDRPIGFISRR